VFLLGFFVSEEKGSEAVFIERIQEE